MATLTITEGFKGAFGVLTELEFEVSGLPGGVELAIDVEPKDNDDDSTNTNLHMAMVAPVKLTGDKDGDDKSSTMTLGMDTNDPMADAMSVPPEVTLTLTLTSTDDAMIPLDVGMITAKVTFKGDAFEDAFTDAATIFEIRPAQCTMLFPLVTVMAPWQTVISITNPGYGEETAAGSLEFTFYGMNSEPETYTTGPDTPGSGLEVDGTLAAGGTYQAYIRDILAAAEWGETFVGHVYVTADYTGCTGLGWVTDFEKVNQAYLAVVIDDDTGKDD